MERVGSGTQIRSPAVIGERAWSHKSFSASSRARSPRRARLGVAVASALAAMLQKVLLSKPPPWTLQPGATPHTVFLPRRSLRVMAEDVVPAWTVGKSGAGKTSMRSIIFANYLARDTMRLGATIDVEHSHVRFLGNLVLNLWDCGGQEAFMENYFESQRDHIFRNVQVLIYVFDIESRELAKDMEYYASCLQAVKQNSQNAKIFCLVHKMDLIPEEQRDQARASDAPLSSPGDGHPRTLPSPAAHASTDPRIGGHTVTCEDEAETPPSPGRRGWLCGRGDVAHTSYAAPDAPSLLPPHRRSSSSASRSSHASRRRSAWACSASRRPSGTRPSTARGPRWSTR